METKSKRKPRDRASMIALGIVIGAGIGTALNNFGVGIAIGIALGPAMEWCFSQTRHRQWKAPDKLHQYRSDVKLPFAATRHNMGKAMV